MRRTKSLNPKGGKVGNVTTSAMDKAISAADANRKFSQLLREVRDGQTYIVTSHGRPVARISPVAEEGRSNAKAELLAHIENQPVRRIRRWKRDELYD